MGKGDSSKQEANIILNCLYVPSLIDTHQQLELNFTMPPQSNTDWNKIQEEKTFLLKKATLYLQKCGDFKYAWTKSTN